MTWNEPGDPPSTPWLELQVPSYTTNNLHTTWLGELKMQLSYGVIITLKGTLVGVMILTYQSTK